MNCDSKKTDKSIPVQPQQTIETVETFDIKEHILNFTSLTSDQDTIEVFVNLTMDYYQRGDLLTLTKRDSSLVINTTIREGNALIPPNEFKKNILDEIVFDNKENTFESHFARCVERAYLADNSTEWIYRIRIKNENLTFYVSSIDDKTVEIKEYFKFMQGIYPNETDFYK